MYPQIQTFASESEAVRHALENHPGFPVIRADPLGSAVNLWREGEWRSLSQLAYEALRAESGRVEVWRAGREDYRLDIEPHPRGKGVRR